MAEKMPKRKVFPNNRGAIKYNDYESRQMQGIGEKVTTICSYYLVLRDKENNERETLDKGKTRANRLKHAEIIAIEKMKKKYVKTRPLYASSLIVELIFWINNSPCEECQYQIVREFQQLKKLLPTAKFHFILFFSFFYKKPHGFKTCLRDLKIFCNNLFTNNIQITIGLKLVTRMAPKPKGRIKGIPPWKKQDRTLTWFRNLYQQCKENVTNYTSEYTIIPSHPIFIRNKNFLKKRSNPHFSICPSDNLDLDDLKLTLSKYSQYIFFPKIKKIRKKFKKKIQSDTT